MDLEIVLFCLYFRQLEKILDDESVPTEAEKYVGSLTAAGRVEWAQARQRFFSGRVNKRSLSAIEDAAFCVALDDESYKFDEVNSKS